jgi:hypothetical protein
MKTDFPRFEHPFAHRGIAVLPDRSGLAVSRSGRVMVIYDLRSPTISEPPRYEHATDHFGLADGLGPRCPSPDDGLDLGCSFLGLFG